MKSRRFITFVSQPWGRRLFRELKNLVDGVFGYYLKKSQIKSSSHCVDIHDEEKAGAVFMTNF